MLSWIVSSSILILLMMALRAVIRDRVSPRLRYALWLLVLARLLLPKETEPDFAKISGWQDQPGEAFCLLAYGIFRANGQVGPYIVEEDPLKTAFFPELSAGWYFLRDDSPETGPVIDRHSLNVTLAQYDPATHTLWYARLDT